MVWINLPKIPESSLAGIDTTPRRAFIFEELKHLSIDELVKTLNKLRADQKEAQAAKKKAARKPRTPKAPKDDWISKLPLDVQTKVRALPKEQQAIVMQKILGIGN